MTTMPESLGELLASARSTREALRQALDSLDTELAAGGDGYDTFMAVKQLHRDLETLQSTAQVRLADAIASL